MFQSIQLCIYQFTFGCFNQLIYLSIYLSIYIYIYIYTIYIYIYILLLLVSHNLYIYYCMFQYIWGSLKYANLTVFARSNSFRLGQLLECLLLSVEILVVGVFIFGPTRVYTFVKTPTSNMEFFANHWTYNCSSPVLFWFSMVWFLVVVFFFNFILFIYLFIYCISLINET